MMKSIIRFSLIMFALICFSNIGMAQKKNKKKAKTTISAKKKKKSTKNSKKNTKKTSSKKKQSNLKRPTVAKYSIPESNSKASIEQNISIPDVQIKKNIADSVPDKVVTIVSAFKPQLKNIAKIGFVNATAIVDTTTVVLSYMVPSQNLSFQYQPIALVPRAIKIDALKKLKQSANFKVGMGNYMNQLIELDGSYVDQNNQEHQMLIQSESIAGDHPLQKWNRLGMNYNGALSFGQFKKLYTQIYFNQSNRYRYGLVPDTTNLPLNNFRQKLTVVAANFTLANNNVSSSRFCYTSTLNLNHSLLLDQANNVAIDLNSPLQYKLNDRIQFHANLNISFNQYQPTNRPSNQNSIVQFDPSFELNKAKFRLDMGIRPTLTNGAFALYPKIEFSKQLKDTNFVIKAGWNTTVLNNQLVHLMGQNHWISAPNSLPISSNEKKYFNVNVTVNKRLNYGFNMSLNDYRELPFFNQSKSIKNIVQEGLKFDVLFEKRAIAIELKGDLRYQLSDQLLWKNDFKYTQFNLIRENTQAWGIVPFEFNSQFNWIFSKSLLLDVSGQFWTGSKTSAGLGNAYQLNNTFVLNAGMQYSISDQWTFWGKGENLLNQQYQRWANYPSLGVQFIAGIQYKFKK